MWPRWQTTRGSKTNARLAVVLQYSLIPHFPRNRCPILRRPVGHTLEFMPAVGDLVRCTTGVWIARPPQRCPNDHRFGPYRVLVGHQPCGTCRGGHTTWTCLECGGVVYGPPLTAGCQILVGAAAVR
jgi:hypothetical protein